MRPVLELRSPGLTDHHHLFYVGVIAAAVGDAGDDLMVMVLGWHEFNCCCSYGLFKMFDDVMFLAKGGRTVYLGPVSEVEDYFSGIGLMVPDRINPPDHYMDALEGIAVPLDQPDFDPQNLPVMWMINKGYNIPPDLATQAAELQAGTMRGKSMKNPTEPKRKTSFFQDFLNEVRAFFIVRKDLLISSFQRVENKSGRNTPGFLRQVFIILRR